LPRAFIRGAECVYEVAGTGPALVAVHSVGLSTREGWRAQVPVLGRSHRMVTYDIRGMGESDAGAEPLGVETFAHDLAALMDHLAIESTILMGVSLGGFVSQTFACANPDRVKALVLVSTACRIAQGNTGTRAARNARIRADGMGVAAGPQLESHFTDAFRSENPDIMIWYRDHYCANDPESYIAVMEDLGRFDYCDEIEAITCPTLIVAGAEDTGPVAGKVPLENACIL
jgi:3-oxoadipate enol-lactonase